MKSYGWALVQCGWCPYKKRLGQTCTHREDHVRSQREDKLRREASEETKPAHAQISSFRPLERGEHTFCCLSHPLASHLILLFLFPPEESEVRCHTAWVGGRSRPQGFSFLSQRTYTNHTPESDLDAFPERRQEDDEKSNEQSGNLLHHLKGMGGGMI